ncbi:MAG: hypothetical protein HY290_17010, partial [Planctomycetia bacterium]|nr:hypothetical protein [Planctomycetia bacterium]
TEAKGMLTLAGALADQFRNDEAIELYWRAFEKSPQLDGKLSVVSKLADLYLQTNHFDRLVERFERGRREANQEREQTICLAQAYQSAGDYGTARQELERLLSQNNRDTQLLQQLSNLAENEGDLAGAVKYQEQLAASAPSRENQTHLAHLLMRSGETDQAVALWNELAANEEDPSRLIATLDNLLAHRRHATLLKITGRLLLRQPDNWELLYREGAALAAEKRDDAAERFIAILALRLSDDEPCAASRERNQRAGSRPPTALPQVGSARPTLPLQARLNAAYTVRSLVGLDSFGPYSTAASAWGPQDFGQARLAALAWLIQLAGKAGAERELIAELRKPLDDANADPRGLWDWCYLQIFRQNDSEVAAAARRLADRGDPLAQWLYLSTVAGASGRTSPSGARVPASQQVARAAIARQMTGRSATSPLSGPPLPDEVLDHLVATFQSLLRKRPDLLTEVRSTIVADVLAELKRAGRTAEAESLYASVVSGAVRREIRNPEARQMALELAAARGDLAVSLALFDEVAEDQFANAQRSSQAIESAAETLAMLMSTQSVLDAPENVLAILERYLAYSQRRRRMEAVAPGLKKAKPARNAAAARGRQVLRIYAGRTLRPVLINYPTANDYFDLGGMTLLRQAEELFRQAELSGELIARVRKRAATDDASQRLSWRLGLAYLSWWQDDYDGAVSEMARAVELAPDDPALGLELAELCERRSDYASALAIADAIVPRDQQMVHERESLVLRLAMNVGNRDRARAAAKRLSGLRLDAVEQVEVANWLKQLELNDEAQNLMSRARRSAGNRLEALQALMAQYQVEQKIDQAVQVAKQILKQGPRGQQSQRQTVGRSAARVPVDQTRQRALQVLVQAGRIDELIARTEAQLLAAPASKTLVQSLSEMYQSAGRSSKIDDILARAIEARPDDPLLRCQIAQQLAQAGKLGEAADHYKAAFQRDPSLMGQHLNYATAVFAQAQRSDELLALVESAEGVSIGTSSALGIFAQALANGGDRIAALRLLRKRWDDLPASYRQQLLIVVCRSNRNVRNQNQNQNQNQDLRTTPEMYELLRHALLSDNGSGSGGWSGTDEVLGSFVQSEGQMVVESLVSWLMVSAASEKQRLMELQRDVVQRLEESPDWRGGRVLLAIIHVHEGKPELAVPLVERLLADETNPMPANACWVLGQELRNAESTRPLAIALLEKSVEQLKGNLNYLGSPAKLLVSLYRKTDRPERARDLLMKLCRDSVDDGTAYDAASFAFVQLNNLSQIGMELQNLGYHVDSFRVFQSLLANTELVRSAKILDPSAEQFLNPVRQGLVKASNAIAGKSFSGALDTLLGSEAGLAPKSGGPVVDLLTIVLGQEGQAAGTADLANLRVASPTAEALLAAAKWSPEQQADVQTRIADLLARFPDDLSVLIAAALWELALQQPDAAETAVARLVTRIEGEPLEDLPAGTRPTPEQRIAAARWIGLWPAARECLKSSEHHRAGAPLAERAVAAARRQLDGDLALAMLREWGQLALEREDLPEAEQRWLQIVELSLPSRIAAPGGAEVAAEASRSETATGASAVAHALIARRLQAPVPTLAQFNQVAAISKLAAVNKLTSLSQRAIRDALGAGPPLATQAAAGEIAGMPGTGSRTVTVRTATGVQIVQSGMPSSTSGAVNRETVNPASAAQQVDRSISQLVSVWKTAGVPADELYETLAAIVFPAERPNDILVYSRPDPRRKTESVDRLLVNAAIAADRLDDLKARIAARKSNLQASGAAMQITGLLLDVEKPPAK